jgi:hypothetical protein
MKCTVVVPVFVFISFLISPYSVALAASLYIDPAFPTLNMGDSVTLSVRLDTDEAAEECINAVDGVLTYSENLNPVEVSTGDSIFSIWVEQPKIDKEKRTITFAGGVPNGYCGRVPGDPRLTNTLVQIVFRAPGFTVGQSNQNPIGTVEFLPETTAYLNDGFGTKAELTTFGSTVTVGDRPGAELVDPWREAVAADTIEPAPFGITIERLPNEDGTYHAIFNTTDKQTGIDQYQIMEEPLENKFAFNWGRADAPWITTRSPHQLSDQTLNSIIRVKAIDKAGNEYIATLVPDAALRTTPLATRVQYGLLLGLLVLMVFTAGFFGYRIFKKRRNSKDSSVDATHDTNLVT